MLKKFAAAAVHLVFFALVMAIAGRDSSAVLSVDGRPARVFLLGQEVVPGTKLVAVTSDTVVLESGGARQEVRMPPRAVAAFGGAPPPPNYTREGNTLTAPAIGGATPIAPQVPPQTMTPPPQPGAAPSQPQ